MAEPSPSISMSQACDRVCPSAFSSLGLVVARGAEMAHMLSGVRSSSSGTPRPGFKSSSCAY
jgi:hypothetical protein